MMHWALLEEERFQREICEAWIQHFSPIPTRYLKTEVLIAEMKEAISEIDWDIIVREETIAYAAHNRHAYSSMDNSSYRDWVWCCHMVRDSGPRGKGLQIDDYKSSVLQYNQPIADLVKTLYAMITGKTDLDEDQVTELITTWAKLGSRVLVKPR